MPSIDFTNLTYFSRRSGTDQINNNNLDISPNGMISETYRVQSFFHKEQLCKVKVYKVQWYIS